MPEARTGRSSRQFAAVLLCWVVLACGADRNQLASLPREIEKLTRLRKLNIAGNKLSDGDIKRLERAMPQCEILHD